MSGKNKKKNKTKKRHYVSGFTWFAILLGGIVTFLCAAFFVFGWWLNSYYVSEAQKGKYHPGMEKYFGVVPFPNEYIIWYNIGNYYYDKGDYEEAEEYYLKAIECGIPYGKECPVKVNLALAMMAQLSEDEWEEFFYCYGPDDMNASARKVEKTLKEARDILTEDGCAHEDDDEGHDEQAQQLKEEIDELLENSNCDEEEEEEETGEEPSDDEDDEDEQDQDEEDGEDGGSMDEEDIMEHIQQQLDENQTERNDDQEFYQNYYGIGNDGGTVELEHGEVW